MNLEFDRKSYMIWQSIFSKISDVSVVDMSDYYFCLKILSTCILIHKDTIGDNAKKRIDKMIETNDGFIIAEEDLKIRGSGEILGKKQSGIPSFKIAELSFDSDLLEHAREYVGKISKNNPKFRKKFPQNLKNSQK